MDRRGGHGDARRAGPAEPRPARRRPPPASARGTPRPRSRRRARLVPAAARVNSRTRATHCSIVDIACPAGPRGSARKRWTSSASPGGLDPDSCSPVLVAASGRPVRLVAAQHRAPVPTGVPVGSDRLRKEFHDCPFATRIPDPSAGRHDRVDTSPGPLPRSPGRGYLAGWARREWSLTSVSRMMR